MRHSPGVREKLEKEERLWLREEKRAEREAEERRAERQAQLQREVRQMELEQAKLTLEIRKIEVQGPTNDPGDAEGMDETEEGEDPTLRTQKWDNTLAARTKRFGDIMRHVLPKMPAENSELPQFFETLKSCFRSMRFLTR